MPRGKCDHCYVRWAWTDRLRVADARCPNCQRQLTPTSQNSLLPLRKAHTFCMLEPIMTRTKYLTAKPSEVAKVRRAIEKRNATCRH